MALQTQAPAAEFETRIVDVVPDLPRRARVPGAVVALIRLTLGGAYPALTWLEGL
jgi:hypothetical protein